MIKQIDVNIMVALSKKGRIIGNSEKNCMPGWNLTADRINMSKVTSGHVAFYGKNTFESFPEKYRPLPNRDNIIITRNESYVPFPANDQTHVCYSLTAAALFADELANGNEKEIYVFGGGEIYHQVFFHPMINIKKIIATEVEGDFEGDILFPSIDPERFKAVSAVPYQHDAKNSHDFTIVTYEQIVKD